MLTATLDGCAVPVFDLDDPTERFIGDLCVEQLRGVIKPFFNPEKVRAVLYRYAQPTKDAEWRAHAERTNAGHKVDAVDFANVERFTAFFNNLTGKHIEGDLLRYAQRAQEICALFSPRVLGLCLCDLRAAVLREGHALSIPLFLGEGQLRYDFYTRN
jgi:hypothetical protein